MPIRLYSRVYHWANLISNAFKNRTSDNTTQKLPKVELLVFDVTDACNSRCQHCFIWEHKPSKDMLTLDEIEKTIGDDFFSNLKVVLITGGEPVLRNDINDVIAIIHKVRPQAKISLSTNALLPERVLNVVNSSIAHDIPINLGVSLDAVGEKHDVLRGVKGNFEKADYLLQELMKLKEKHKDKMGAVVVGHTLSNLTVDTIDEVLTYAQRMGVGFITQLHEEFVYYHNVSKGEDKSNNIDNYKCADNSALIDAISKLPPSFQNETLLQTLTHKLKFKCASMRTFFLLRYDGSVSPCLHYSDISSGNVKSHSFDEIWKSASAREARNLVDNCSGCSNSWATGWSYQYWFPAFWKLRTSLIAKNLIFKLKKLGI